MRKVEIIITHDEHDCYTCGPSFADGFVISLDGRVVDTFTPVAHCFGGNSAQQNDKMLAVLKALGIEDVEIEEVSDYADHRI